MVIVRGVSMMKLEIPKSSLLTPLLSPPCTPTPPPEKMLSTWGRWVGGYQMEWPSTLQRCQPLVI